MVIQQRQLTQFDIQVIEISQRNCLECLKNSKLFKAQEQSGEAIELTFNLVSFPARNHLRVFGRNKKAKIRFKCQLEDCPDTVLIVFGTNERLHSGLRQLGSTAFEF